MTTMKERRIIAIDLGTSNSAVAYWDGVAPKVIRNSFNEPTTPSVVWFNSRRGELVVGKVARERLGIEKEVITSIKRKMGTSEPTYLGGRAYLPHEISAIILGELKKQAEDFFGEPVEQAVITVPAYFEQPKIEATRRAGELAGLEVLDLPAEPTAAALAYYHTYSERGERNWLVYDSGAGTTDISVVALRDGNFDVRGTSGDNYMAGDDFDRLLRDLILKKAGIVLDEGREDHRIAMVRLKQEAERAKIALSAMAATDVIIPYLCDDVHGNPIIVDVEVTRKEFEDLIRPRVERSIEHCLEALEKAGLNTDEIDDIILVGGSGHIPLISQVLEKRLGKRPRKDIDPITCVVEGAAIAASRQKVTVRGKTIEIEFPELKTLTSQTTQDLVGQVRVRPAATAVLRGARVSIRREDGGFTDEVILDERGGFDFELSLVPNAANRFTLVVEDNQGKELGREEIRIDHRDTAPEVEKIEHPTPYAISVGLEGNRTAVLVPVNSDLPKEVTETFYTVEDDQRELRVPVYEGDHPVADRNRLIGEVLVSDIPPGFPQRTPVDVTIEVDRRRLLHVTVTHKGGRSESAVIRPGWELERSMEELKQEYDTLLDTVQDKVRKVKGEDVGRVEQIATELEEGFKAGEKGKVVSRLDDLRKIDDELSKLLPDPKDVEEFNKTRDALLGLAFENPDLVPNLLTRVQAVSGEADRALERGDRRGYEDALSKLKAIQKEVEEKVQREVVKHPDVLFASMCQYFDHQAGPEAQRFAKMLAQEGRSQYYNQVQEIIGKGKQAIFTRNIQGLGFALQELMGLTEQMKDILRRMGAITD